MSAQPQREPALSSRDRVLQRIRAANAKAAPEPAPIPRAYDRTSTRSAAEVLSLFEERLREYDARLFATARADVAARIAEIVRTGRRQRMAVAPGIPAQWQPPGVEWIVDELLPLETLNGVDGALTAASLGVAASGSIVLQHGPAEGRRVLTLLPDYHLCVLEAAQIVDTLPEAFARLDPARPVTFVSGPSATADIEMTRVKGVHGPRFLDVVLIED